MRRSILQLALTLLLLSCIGLVSAQFYDEDEEMINITKASDLAADARQGVPMLMLVSQEYCPFCVQIKREILGPMLKAGDYKDQILIRELYIDLGGNVKNFQGHEISSAEFALGYGVDLTPTLLFLDSNGEELAKRIIGINTPEMFYFYVDEAIKESLTLIQQ